MPGLGLRARLFGSIVVLFVVFAFTSGWWLAGQLRAELVQDVEHRLEAHARTFARVIPAETTNDALARLTADLSETTEARVTVIRSDGVVLADSRADAASMDNHGSRPEVVAALAQGYGASARFSTTVRRQMLYVAVPWPQDDPAGVVRLAKPLDDVEARVGRIWRALLLAGLGGLVLTLVGAALLSERYTRDLRELTVRARSLARPPTGGGDEIAWISGSIDRLSQELRDAVDDVAAERNRLHAVLAGMREAVIAVDGDARVVLTNPAARDLFALAEDAVGRPLVEALGNQALSELVDEVLASGMAGSSDVRWSTGRPTGTFDLMVTVTPQVGAGAVVVAHDVTALRRLEAVRRDFVANVSHELRTPIAVIQSSAEALRDGALDDPKHGPRFVDAVHRHAERLGLLISDLLELARIEGGRFQIDLRTFELAPVVGDALDPLESRAEERNQTVVVDVDPDLTVRADAVALRQVVSNLVDNAIKYCPEGSHIEVTARRVDVGVEVAVADDGPGIADIHHGRVFERFYRVDPGRSRDMGGTGLGLSIVRHLVDIQGASIRLENNLPSGARFVVTIAAGDGDAPQSPESRGQGV